MADCQRDPVPDYLVIGVFCIHEIEAGHLPPALYHRLTTWQRIGGIDIILADSEHETLLTTLGAISTPHQVAVDKEAASPIIFFSETSGRPSR